MMKEMSPIAGKIEEIRVNSLISNPCLIRIRMPIVISAMDMVILSMKMARAPVSVSGERFFIMNWRMPVFLNGTEKNRLTHLKLARPLCVPVSRLPGTMSKIIPWIVQKGCIFTVLPERGKLI